MTKREDEHEKLTKVFTTKGLIEVPIKNEEDASTIGMHWNATKSYLNTGESLELKLFEGTEIKIHGKIYRLNTNLEDVEELYDAGELSFDDIYEFIY